MLEVAQMNLNIKKLEKSWVYDRETIPLVEGGFTIGQKHGTTPKGRVDYEDFKYFTVAASGQPLYIKEDGGDWHLVKSREQVQKILDNVPAVLYPEI